jgi:hypothetical protein
LASYQPRIKAQVDQLIESIHAIAGGPIDATLWSIFFTFDVMGDVAFSRDFGNMRGGKEHRALREMHGLITMIGLLTAVPWLPSLISDVPGARRGVAGFYNFCNNALVDKQKVCSRCPVLLGSF